MNDVTMSTLHTMLRGLSARQQAIADNVANVETPGYRAKVVDFETSLREALSGGTNPGTVDPVMRKSTAAPLPNGNNVQIDQEMVAMTETNLRYELAIQAMNSKFAVLRSSIQAPR